MKSKRFQFKKSLLRLTSAALVFWLSSVLVLVCCSPQFFTASAMQMDASCPMSKGHECCKKNQGDSISEAEKDKATCCVYKPQRTLSTELQTVQIVKQTPTVAEKVQAPKPIYFVKNSYVSPKVYHSAIRNRGSTYKEICVFRI